jgi:hypothetical protein
MNRLFLATVALTVAGMLAAESLGTSPNTFLVIGCVVLTVGSGIQAFYGNGSE